MLDICSGYVGESLKYFGDTSAGMGYIELSTGGSDVPVPVVHLDFSKETVYNSLTNQVDGSAFTEVVYTGSGFSLVGNALNINKGNDMQITNLPNTTFTIMFNFTWRTTSQYWHSISFKESDGGFTAFINNRHTDNVSYQANNTRQNSANTSTTPTYSGQIFNINQKYSFAFVKTSTVLKFYVDNALLTTMNNSNTLTSIRMNSENGTSHTRADVAVENVKIKISIIILMAQINEGCARR